MIKKLARSHLTAAVRNGLHGLIREFQGMRMHRRGVREATRFHNKVDLKLHLGCGTNLKPGFINIDLNDKADLTLDLREPLPLPDNSCVLVYSEHFLEHIEYPGTALSLLRDCYRVMRPGGIFSGGVPDTEWPLLEYAGVRQQGYFKLAKQRWHPEWCVTEMEQINFHFRQGEEHRFAYDFKTLCRILGQAGFVAIRRRAFQPDLDSSKWKEGTLYVDAIKPS